MKPDVSTLLEQWLRFETPDANHHPAAVPVTLDSVSRNRIAHIVLEELSAIEASQVPDAARTAKAFVKQIVACRLKPGDMKCEANALCLAVLNADLHTIVNKDNVPDCQTMRYINSFSERVNSYYLNNSAVDVNQVDCLAESPLQPESLQHALRSPLQGAMLFLDLMREDAQHGSVALEDVDSVIDSLKHVARLLDAHRDERD